MKNLMKITILCLFTALQLYAQTVDGQFISSVNGSKYEVIVAAKMQSGNGSAGVVSIEFTYNSAALSFPASPVSGTDFVLQGGFAGYNTKNITRPASNKVRISLVTTGTPVSLSTSAVNIVTLNFTITDPNALSNLVWAETQIAPVFSQPTYTVGTWPNLAASLKPPTTDGQFITNINGSTYEVTIAANMQSGTGSAGVVSIEFTFNEAGLSFPMSPVSGTNYTLLGGFAGYNTKNITRPSSNKIRISLVTTGTPVSLSTEPVNIITLYLTITNASQTSDLTWTKNEIAPVFLQSNYPAGTWSGQANPLPVELVSFNANLSESNVILKWTTATEVSNYGFDVERRLPPSPLPKEGGATPLPLGKGQGDGLEDGLWKTIGFVEGSGNSNSPKEYSFVDANPPGGLLQYRLKQIDNDGHYEYFSTVAEVNFSLTDVKENNVPDNFVLSQNYPNPFNPVTTINYELPVSSSVRFIIYNSLGEVVKEFSNQSQNAGYHSIKFDGSNLSSGIYFYSFEAKAIDESNSFRKINKMLLLK